MAMSPAYTAAYHQVLEPELRAKSSGVELLNIYPRGNCSHQMATHLVISSAGHDLNRTVFTVIIQSRPHQLLTSTTYKANRATQYATLQTISSL